MLIDQVCDFLLPAAALHLVADVRLGLGYTAVQLDDGRCGLAYTFRHELHEGCGVMSEAGTLAGRRASDLAQWARSTDLLVSAVGLATLNALIEVPATALDADLLTELKVTSNDVVGMVGYFGPFVAPLRARGKALHIFERRLVADVAAGTALTIFNPLGMVYWVGVTSNWLPFANSVLGSKAPEWGFLMVAASLMTWFTTLIAVVRFIPNRIGPTFFRLVNTILGLILLGFAAFCAMVLSRHFLYSLR